MPIQKIKFGSNASSSVLNDNFDYLQREVLRVNEYVENMNAELDAKIDLINGTIESQLKTFQEKLNEQIKGVQNDVGALIPDYDKETPISFSDSNPYKPEKVGWLTWTPGWTGENGRYSLKVNGKEVLRHYYYKYGDQYKQHILVSPGDIVTKNGGDSTFIPGKEVK